RRCRDDTADLERHEGLRGLPGPSDHPRPRRPRAPPDRQPLAPPGGSGRGARSIRCARERAPRDVACARATKTVRREAASDDRSRAIAAVMSPDPVAVPKIGYGDVDRLVLRALAPPGRRYWRSEERRVGKECRARGGGG